ncbi:MAG: glycosyltransferase family 2 protein [Nitrososphaerota archaeon]|nr:glycosyltransferase family 2 protein [Nitrososphaerota archaeon]MDG6941887.1 glycosyltransferase family 2 protein [Nitrososphaerota archaeon]
MGQGEQVASVEAQGCSRPGTVAAHPPGRRSAALRPARRAPELRIDVCVPSLRPLPGEFTRHLEEVIPVNRIVVDSTKGRGRSRQKLVDQVETEFFAFIDTDVILMPNWFGDVTSAMTDRTGAVEGRQSADTGNRDADHVLSAMGSLNRALGREGPLDTIDRAFTGATLVRTAAVRGIRFPNIHYYEDEYMRLYIEKNGYKWIRTPGENYVHRLSGRDMAAETYESAKCGYLLGLLTPADQLKRLLLQEPFKAAYILARSGDVAAARQLMKRRIDSTRGVLHAYVQHLSLDGAGYATES